MLAYINLGLKYNCFGQGGDEQVENIGIYKSIPVLQAKYVVEPLPCYLNVMCNAYVKKAFPYGWHPI